MEKITVHDTLPSEAMRIRETVFVREQGFTDTAGEDDTLAHHLLLWDGEVPIATCRILKTEKPDEYLIGRIAVVAKRRGEGVGRRLLGYAEEHILSLGGKGAVIHAQCTAQGFYERCGYMPAGEVEYEQGRAHIWMQKRFGVREEMAK